MGKSVNIVAEDVLSEAVIKSILKSYGNHKVSASYPIKKGYVDGILQSGYGYIKKMLPEFNRIAESIPFVVVVDQDDRLCPPKTIAEWLGGEPKHPNLIVRVAVKEIESWLIADKDNLAHFLCVPEPLIPEQPETIADPKLFIVELASSSRSKEIRMDLAPAAGTSASTGPYYSRALSNFAKSNWDIEAASMRSESLKRAIANVCRL